MNRGRSSGRGRGRSRGRHRSPTSLCTPAVVRSRPGDWNCVCGEVNFAWRTECHKCNRSRKNASGHSNNLAAQNVGGGGDRQRHRGGRRQFPPDKLNDIQSLLTILVRKNLPLAQVEKILSGSQPTWLLAWEICQQLTDSQVHALIISLAKVPSSFNLEPPPIPHLRQAAVKYLEGLKHFNNQHDFENIKCRRVDIIVNMCQRLIQAKWPSSNSKSDIQEGLKDILSRAHAFLSVSQVEQRMIGQKIINMIADLDKPWTVSLQASVKTISNQSAEMVATEKSSWQNVTVGWLADPKKFQPSLLPKMRVPNVDSGGVYGSTDEYFFTVQSLWCAMTFGDGNAALSPKCRWKSNDKECGEVLWPLSGRGASTHVHCRTKLSTGKKCHFSAIWACQNRNHPEGLCEICFKRAQDDMMGPPGPRASTHIYDGVVVKIDYEGRIFIEDIVSRRPPQTAIHWRTTSRLSCPNLVAIVKLDSREASLTKERKINWAEITFHSEAKEEYLRREEGKLSVTLVSIGGDTNVHNLLSHGDKVAVIDCQTFVPEYIPVLKALDIQKLTPLPFQNGALLNLSFRDGATGPKDLSDDESQCSPDDSQGSVDSDTDSVAISSFPPPSCLDSSTAFKVRKTIEESQLEPIVKIRMDSCANLELRQELEHLVKKATLDKEQLESFLQALREPVHLTQGPPGTGKSYVGVVMVRALLLIRKLWMRVCPEVGQPPILVLSYKNHAIDEFLRDLIRDESRSLSLIRIGGSCKDQDLLPYAEHNQRSYQQETIITRSHLRYLYDTRVEILKMKKSLSPFINFKAVSMEPNPPGSDAEKKSRQSVLFAGVIFVNNLICRVKILENTFEKDEDEIDISTLWKKLFHDYKPDETLPLVPGDIEALLDGISHYNIDLPYPEILLRWLRGTRPFPRCKFGKFRCTEVAVSFDPGFCNQHQCFCLFGPSQRCHNEVAKDSNFCDTHTCAAPDCTEIKDTDLSQKFCSYHACFVCLHQGLVAELALDMPPRNACQRHPLCCATGCKELATETSSYCQDHENLRCAAIDRSGKRCEHFIHSREDKFCWNHKPTTPQLVKSEPKQKLKVDKCHALTTKNKPCKGKPLPGAMFCRDHANHATAISEKNSSEPSIWERPTISDSFISENVMEEVQKTTETVKPLSDETENPEVAKDDGPPGDTSDFEVIDEEDLPDEDCEQRAHDNPDEVEESENVQHLREVFVIDGPDEDFMEDEELALEEDAAEESFKHDGNSGTRMLPSEWHWEMTIEERWNQIDLLEEWFWQMMSKLDDIYKQEVEVARRQHHEAKIRANTKVYENKAVIGGTIVGCITRLEAIRATQPFAILVEEASEVLEPLLFSCLCPTTCKLELIGDHLQLKPQIMSKFQFERINRVNISMFERLICAPQAHRVPSTALSIQRRMRKNICDLTRDYYTDIVNITDHKICNTKKIGDGLKRVKIRRDCTGQGREVPGVLPHVFFWTHGGAQTKAFVGISRINRTESEMACNLAKYLVECGVPKQSIAILTPYKGQLMLMRGELIKMGLVEKFQRSGPSCILSTVDRFQGDEADVVIISLVIDARSHTPFVKLVNRMIVLLSRARLGMYILGNIAYFEEKPDASISHWQKTLAMLRQPAPQDTDPSAVTEDLTELDYPGPRLGPELPICCPLHRSKMIAVTNASQLKLGFCDVVCTQELDCSHECGLPCHFVKENSHNSMCSVYVDSPCSQHPDQLMCHQVYQNVGAAAHTAGGLLKSLISSRSFAPSIKMPIDKVLTLYRCDTSVSVQLPCTHVVKMQCNQENDIARGLKSYPKCTEPALTPFVYPSCLHELPCLCHQLQDFKQNPSKVKPCKEKVDYTPSCRHTIAVDCFLKQKYENGQDIFVCPEMMNVSLPRCTHSAKVPCEIEQKLRKWAGRPVAPSLGSKVVVREGEKYGPKDHNCKKEVIFEKICGHQEKMICENAFNMAAQSVRCSVEVDFINPECGHMEQVPCFQKQILERNPQAKRTYPAADFVVEGASKHLYQARILSKNCLARVELKRKCGHIQKVACCEARDGFIKPCTFPVVIPNPYCGHDVEVPCQHVADVQEFEPWGERKNYSNIIVEGVLRDDAPVPDVIPSHLTQVLKNCVCDLVVRRAKTCGHKYMTKCWTAIQGLSSDKSKSLCTTRIKDAPLLCGHFKTMLCSEYSKYMANATVFKCNETVQTPCWNVRACGRMIDQPCHTKGNFASCDQLSIWTCPKGHSFDSVPLCKKGNPQTCPDCSLANAKDYLAKESFKNELKSKLKIPEELKAFQSKPVEAHRHESKFFDAVSQVVQSFLMRCKQEDPMKRPLFYPRIIPCFIALREDQFDVNSFTPKIFVRTQTLNGIDVCEWTTANIKKLLEETEQNQIKIVLLFGFAVVCHVLVNPSDWPSQKQMKNKPYILDNWIADQKKKGFDAVQHKKWNYDSIVIWDPFPMIAVRRIFLDQPSLAFLASKVNIERTLFHPVYLKFHRPDGKSFSAETFNDKELMIDGLLLQAQWDGETLARPSVLKLEVQKDLKLKLAFCQKMSDKSERPDFSPYGGINLLKNLLKSNKTPELDLLFGLELHHHEDYENAKNAVWRYKDALQRSRIIAHPLYIVSRARITDKPDEQRSLLKKFAEFYPHAYQKWLNDAELSIVVGTSAAKGSDKNSNDNDPVERWKILKAEEGVESEAMEKLLKMIGLKKVKNSTITLFKSALQFNRLKPDAKKANMMAFNYCFLGNAGTGKTTVARLVAEILKDAGVRENETFVETSAQKLKDMGPEKFRELVSEAFGGVLFIDEAYDIDPKGDFKGKPIVTELLTAAENDRDKLTIIMAGYEDDMNEKLFSYNEGIKSRFEEIIFEDFDEDEIRSIWNGMIQERKFSCDEKIASVISKRLVKASGRKGFGNARAVRKEVERATRHAMNRKDFDPDDMRLVIDDVMGETPMDNPKLKSVIEEISQMTGWTAIKKNIKELLDLCETNYKRELQGMEPLPLQLNRVFLGNPGTGKTTCAKLYGKLLKELNFLSVGEVVFSTASEFVGSVVGESQQKTNAMIEKARGKVLVIDEAYNLDDNLYGKQVLDVLVEKIQGTPSDDIAVLLLGYDSQMRKMFRDQNPGLARRFNLDQAFNFEDYNDEELSTIFKNECKKKQYKLKSYEVPEKAVKVLSKLRLQPNFGNAGAVQNLIKNALSRAAKRPPSDDGSIEIHVSDIEDAEDAAAERGEDPFAPLAKLYRMDIIRSELVKLKNSFQVAKNEGTEPPDLGHFVFRGSPGTGKTTVARVMAKILSDLGIIGRNYVEETSGLDLTAEYVGHTKKNVEEKLNRAKGGVLFIDEAYELGKNQFGEEAMTTLVAAMTNPEYKGMTIIIAGYAKDIEMMLERNVGLKSRFRRYFDFPDWTGQDCVAFVGDLVKKENFSVDPNLIQTMVTKFDELIEYPGWGNARDAIAWWKSVKDHRANRVVEAPEEVRAIVSSDIDKAFDEMIKARKPKVSDEERRQRLLQDAIMQSLPIESVSGEKNFVNFNFSKNEKHKDDDTHDFVEIESTNRDPDVPDDVWLELEEAKVQEALEKERIKEEFEKAQRLAEEEKRRLEELRIQMEREQEEARRRELERLLEEERERERQRQEEERKRLEKILEEQRRQELIREKLRQISPCPAGFSWHQVSGGWRCGGGSHFVSDQQLRDQFTFEV